MNATQLIVNRFELQYLLGRGGMGEVYRAIDAQTGETVAVKALNPEILERDPSLLERFVREGEALRQLNHPNIVHMVTAFEENQHYYLVMEYVGGGSLQDLLSTNGQLPHERVIQIALDLADALTRAHRLGIIHRDLKPANVLLAEDGTPRLADFGIAHITSVSPLTQTGIAIGSIDYLSPEACRGEAPDERADIWSFGVLLFQLLSGQKPFKGDSMVAKLNAILTQKIPDLSQLAPNVPDSLVDLIYRMLEKDAQQRIPSVRLVGAELEAMSKGREPVTPSRSISVESRFETPTPSTSAPKHNLPTQTTPFVGREEELRELSRLLTDSNVRLLTVLGVGGMGKTRLAIEAGREQIDRFERGVHFVSLAGLESIEAIVPTIAKALEFSFYEGGEPRKQLLDYLREKNLLLIMDNFEHLLEGASLVSEILQNAPKVKALTTSRMKLSLQDEHIFHLEGMDFPDWETPADAMEYSAVKLFLQSARRAKPGFELVADDLKYVARICRLVGGMPLGILLAAAWIEMLSLPEIAKEIEQNIDFLETSLSDVPERQHSMRAVFDYAWKLLNEKEQKVLRGLSVFRGGFTREAAQDVTGASLRDLMGLVDKSLIHRDPTGRYNIHELLRQYGTERLAEIPDEVDMIGNHHSEYFSEFLHDREIPIFGREQKRALNDIEIEIENIRTVWNWAVAHDHIRYIDRALETLAEFYRLESRIHEGEILFSLAVERLAEILDHQQDNFTKLVHAKIQSRQGSNCSYISSEKAIKLAESSLATFREMGDPREEAQALYALGYNLMCDGEYVMAKNYFQEGVNISQKINDRLWEANCLGQLGLVESDLNNWETSKSLLKKSLIIFQEIGNPDRIANVYILSAFAHFSICDYATAKQLLEESLKFQSETTNPSMKAITLRELGMAASRLTDFEQGIRYIHKSLALSKEIGAVHLSSDCLINLCEIYLELKEYDLALHSAQELITFTEKLENYLTPTYYILSKALAGSGDIQTARGYLGKAWERIRLSKDPRDKLDALEATASYLEATGKNEKALELVTLISSHPLCSSWTKECMKKSVERLATKLSPEIMLGAQERGRTGDFETATMGLITEFGEGQ